jgi:hypothetical protein
MSYFVALRLHSPKKWKAGITKWRRENPEKVREASRLRMRRFRARRK